MRELLIKANKIAYKTVIHDFFPKCRIIDQNLRKRDNFNFCNEKNLNKIGMAQVRFKIFQFRKCHSKVHNISKNSPYYGFSKLLS